MPDTKITALTAIGANPIIPATFPIPMVDLTDTSMAASGTTKKVTVNQILGAGGAATLASATITGDLTVRTNKLAVTSTGVGAGTASPLSVFTVQSQASARLSVRTTDAVFGTVTGGTAFDSLNGSDASLVPFGVRGSTVTLGSSAGIGFQIDASGNATWQNVGGVAGTAMTLNSTGLGVGVSPSFKLSAAGVSQFYAESDGIYASGNLSPDLYTIGVNYWNAAGTEGIKVSARPSWKIEHKNSSDALAYLDIGFRAASAAASAFTSRFKIDGSGNVISNVTGTAPTLATNSQMVFNLTSNTNLRISVRGTDGVTRTANITLA